MTYLFLRTILNLKSENTFKWFCFEEFEIMERCCNMSGQIGMYTIPTSSIGASTSLRKAGSSHWSTTITALHTIACELTITTVIQLSYKHSNGEKIVIVLTCSVKLHTQHREFPKEHILQNNLESSISQIIS